MARFRKPRPHGRDNLADYLIPARADMPRFDIHMLAEDEPHLGSGGVKGIGMLGTCGTALPSDPKFQEEWMAFLDQLGALLAAADHEG